VLLVSLFVGRAIFRKVEVATAVPEEDETAVEGEQLVRESI
jgi:hypothetical protein